MIWELERSFSGSDLERKQYFRQQNRKQFSNNKYSDISKWLRNVWKAEQLY